MTINLISSYYSQNIRNSNIQNKSTLSFTSNESLVKKATSEVKKLIAENDKLLNEIAKLDDTIVYLNRKICVLDNELQQPLVERLLNSEQGHRYDWKKKLAEIKKSNESPKPVIVESEGIEGILKKNKTLKEMKDSKLKKIENFQNIIDNRKKELNRPFSELFSKLISDMKDEIKKAKESRIGWYS